MCPCSDAEERVNAGGMVVNLLRHLFAGLIGAMLLTWLLAIIVPVRSASQLQFPYGVGTVTAYVTRCHRVGASSVNIVYSDIGETLDGSEDNITMVPNWAKRRMMQFLATAGGTTGEARFVAFGWPLPMLSYRAERDASWQWEVADNGLLLWDANKSSDFALRALPFGLYWPGVLVNTLVMSVIWLCVLNIGRVLLRMIRHRFNRCEHCGYDLRGTDRRGCPECGWDLSEKK